MPKSAASKKKKEPDGQVFAVASGPKPGIYFGWADSAELATRHAHQEFTSFSSQAAAERHLATYSHLQAPANSGWMSTQKNTKTKQKEPILYTILSDMKENQEKTALDPPPSSPASRPKKRAKRDKAKTNKQGVSLDPVQQKAVDAALNGQNVFLTGVAGTGKSLVTRLIYEQAVQRFGNKKKHVGLCAPTGMASVGLGANGQTLHTLAGVKVPSRASDFGSMNSVTNRRKWNDIQCLILDECGMLSADFLDWLDVHVRTIRRQPLAPFGGIQLVFVGDFCQLGPVPGSVSLSSSSRRKVGPPYPPSQPEADCFLNIQECTAYAFQSALWREANFTHVHLTKVYRQSDEAFVQALQDLREQRPHSPRVQNLVEKCSIPLEDMEARRQAFPDVAKAIPEGILPTLLYTNNRNADRENSQRLAALPPMHHKRFVAVDKVSMDAEVPTHALDYVHRNLTQNKFFDQCQASQNLDLRVGAQVMLVQNLYPEEELVNGSRGVVERFALVPMIQDFHKTQERLLGPDDVGHFPGFTFGQLKFGMSCRIDDKMWKIFKFVKMPVVRFLNNKTKIILPAKFERTLFRQGTCSREQLPLRLAWALTIHKAQGCTLDWLICDLQGCFTAGQAYVALSRAKSMEGLQIRNFSPHHVLTNPLVDGFYQALAQESVPDFLRDQAGLWWYPLLRYPDWLAMFTQASGSAASRSNAAQFQEWVANYKPPDDYHGWMGYSEGNKSIQRTSGAVARSPVPTEHLPATFFGKRSPPTVTPTFSSSATSPFFVN